MTANRLSLGTAPNRQVDVTLAETPRFGEADRLFVLTPNPFDQVCLGGVAFQSNEVAEIQIPLSTNADLRGHVGLLAVELNGVFVGEIEIVPGKMSEGAYRTLRSDLENVWSGLVLDPTGRGRLAAGIPPAADLLGRIDAAVRSILQDPSAQLRGEPAVRHLRQVRRPAELTASLLRRSGLGLPGLTRVMTRTTDNAANGLVATSLRRLQRYAVRSDDPATSAACHRYLSHPVLTGAPPWSGEDVWAARTDARYRKVHAVARILDRPDLAATEGPGELRWGVTAIQRLYEYWVFLQVLLEAREHYGEPLDNGFSDLAVRTPSGLRLELPSGTTLTFPGPVHVAFEPAIMSSGRGWMGLEYAGVVPVPGVRDQSTITPDVVVYRPGDRPSALVLDAKYVARGLRESAAAEIHRKYARIRCAGSSIVRAVLAVHPHEGPSVAWAGYGHLGMTPGTPRPWLPLPPGPSHRRQTVAPSPQPAPRPPDVLAKTGTARDKVSIIVDQFSSREILGNRRVDFRAVARKLAGARFLMTTSVVMPELDLLKGFEAALKGNGIRVVHQANPSREARFEAILEAVSAVDRDCDILVITVDEELEELLLERRPDAQFIHDL